MSERTISRRGFLAAGAGAAALAGLGAGAMGFGEWNDAIAEGVEKGEIKTVHSLCNSCSSKCGFTAYVKDGELVTMIGDEQHPYCEGTLCARGYAYASIAWSEDRLTEPLKKNDKGAFEPISWDQAYAEIAEKVQSIIGSDGPQALAMIQDPRPSGSYSSARARRRGKRGGQRREAQSGAAPNARARRRDRRASDASACSTMGGNPTQQKRGPHGKDVHVP